MGFSARIRGATPLAGRQPASIYYWLLPAALAFAAAKPSVWNGTEDHADGDGTSSMLAPPPTRRNPFYSPEPFGWNYKPAEKYCWLIF
jgi:hypothetical protein